MENDIKVSLSGAASPLAPSEDVLCFVYLARSLPLLSFLFPERLSPLTPLVLRCKTHRKQYLCPRCSLPYCSLACYKVQSPRYLFLSSRLLLARYARARSD